MDESRDHHESDQDTQYHIKQAPDIDLVDLIARPETFRHEKSRHHHDRRKLDATDQVQFIGSKEVLEDTIAATLTEDDLTDGVKKRSTGSHDRKDRQGKDQPEKTDYQHIGDRFQHFDKRIVVLHILKRCFLDPGQRTGLEQFSVSKGGQQINIGRRRIINK